VPGSGVEPSFCVKCSVTCVGIYTVEVFSPETWALLLCQLIWFGLWYIRGSDERDAAFVRSSLGIVTHAKG